MNSELEIRLDCLKKDCLACRKCAIGGKNLDGTEWKWDWPPNEPPISNVFSNMNCGARVMVVGQNPGQEEVTRGEPFVGPSGKFFDVAVEDVTGLTRADLYISNAVRCYSPGNRRPTAQEVENCGSFLDAEIEILKPLVIVALGALAFQRLTGMAGIMKHVGECVVSPRYLIPVVALLHPSPYNTNVPEKRELFMDGLRALRGILDKKG